MDYQAGSFVLQSGWKDGAALSERYDAIVVGGGHNGLTAAAYLAKAGARTLLVESRSDLGGASRTEQPWGPEYKVTALSYVVSLMPQTLVKELNLASHGYRIYPQGSYFIPFHDGEVLALAGKSPEGKRDEIARFSRRDARALEEWDAWIGNLGALLGPLLTIPAPALGSRRPEELLDQLKFLWKMRGFDVRTTADFIRLMTMSIADLLDDWFESPQIKAMLAVSGVIGTWAGPFEPGTAYVMLHHHIGDIGQGRAGEWGFPEGGMGGLATALAASARSFGAEIRTSSPVAAVTTSGGRATGIVLESGDEILGRCVVTSVHPQIAFLKHLDRSELPDDFIEDIERWNTRSGVVKINLALAELPKFRACPRVSPDIHGAAIVHADTIEQIEEAFLDARSGRPATLPFADVCIPSVLDPTLAPGDRHLMSMFTQWVPETWAQLPDDVALEAYVDRMLDAFDDLAPNFKSSILHRQVIGPHEMERDYHLIGGNIFHGELSPEQLFHMRPAPGYADYSTPVHGLYQCGSATHGGGGVTGIPGRNVVRRIRKDRRKGKMR